MKKQKKRIPVLNDWWWLRSAGRNPHRAAGVNPGGSTDKTGAFIELDDEAVRPVLIISDFVDCHTNTGEKVEYGGYIWTAVLDNMAVCDEIIGRHRFDANTNDYEKSEIRQYLENWLEEKMKEEESL